MVGFGGKQALGRAPFVETVQGRGFRWEPEDFFETGDRVVVFVRQIGRGRESGAEVAVRAGHLWTMRNGRAVRWQGFPEREKALEAAGLEE